MCEEITLHTDMDLSCDIHDCNEESTTLWHGLSIEEQEAYGFVATYCKSHTKSHAEQNENFTKVGSFHPIE